MKTQNQIRIQALKVAIILVVIVVTVMNSANAQSFKRFARESQLGFEGSFGIKTFSISSDIAKINGLKVTEEGGSVGVGIGAGPLRLKLRQGYYYSSSAVAHTVDEIRTSLGANIYPVKFFGESRSMLQPYLTTTLERNVFKMHGTYGENNAPQNYSITEAPYLGSINSVVASVGAGLEYKISNPGHFISFFAEGRYGKTMEVASTNRMFNNTSIPDQVVMNIGIAFGYSR